MGNIRFNGVQKILLLIPLFNFLIAQAPDTLWTKIYGDTGWEEGYSVQQTLDNGYIITGEKFSTTTYEYDLFLMKTDANGDSLWLRTYGGLYYDGGLYVLQTRDSGYIVCGKSWVDSINHTDIYLIKVKSNGDLQWEKSYGGFGYDEGWGVVETYDGYLITGNTTSYSNSGDVFLMKVDSTGDSVWFRIYGGAGCDLAYSLRQTLNGGLIIAGYTTSFGLNGDVLLIKTNQDGDTIWVKNYGTSGVDIGYAVEVCSNGDYLVSGFTDSSGNWDVYLLRIDSLGDTLWTKHYGGNNDEVAHSVVETVNEQTVIAGGTNSYGAGSTDVYLVKTDASGNLIWQKTWGFSGDEESYAIIKTNDRGYIICGYIDTLGTGENRDIYLIKTMPDTLDISGQKIFTALSHGVEIFPNPFYSKVTISISNPFLRCLNEKEICIYDVSGKLVRRLPLSNIIEWDGKDDFNNTVSCGIYFCVIQAGKKIISKKVVLLK